MAVKDKRVWLTVREAERISRAYWRVDNAWESGRFRDLDKALTELKTALMAMHEDMDEQHERIVVKGGDE